MFCCFRKKKQIISESISQSEIYNRRMKEWMRENPPNEFNTIDISDCKVEKLNGIIRLTPK